MSAILQHLLAHEVAQNEYIPNALAHLVAVLSSTDAISSCEREQGTRGPVLHRWNLRILSLVGSALPSAVRTAGFRLLQATFKQSSTCLVDHAKQVITPALNVLNDVKADGELWLATLDVVELILASSLEQSAEWARDVVAATTVQAVAKALVRVANEGSEEVRSFPQSHSSGLAEFDET